VPGIESFVDIGELRYVATPNVTNYVSSEKELAPKTINQLSELLKLWQPSGTPRLPGL